MLDRRRERTIHDDTWRCANQHHNKTTQPITQHNDDDPPTRRREGGHLGSITQTHQANDDLNARRAAATTHAEDSRERGHLARYHNQTLSTRHNERQQNHEMKTPTSRTSQHKRTTRRLMTTTAPPESNTFPRQQSQGRRRRKYILSHGHVPISSHNTTAPNNGSTRRQPTQNTETKQQKPRNGGNPDGPHKQALADKR